MIGCAKTEKAAVLVVEDEPSVMAFVRTALERSGYSVRSADSGGDAIELLKSSEFLGVISDMRTPGDMDGAGLYDWVAENRPDLAKRWVFITGDTVNPETAHALERTGAPFIEKPFRVVQLIGMVRQVFGESE